MPLEKRPDAEPIRGYRLIDRLGAGGFGEVWKCEAPGGIFKAVKFVYGNLNGLDAGAARAEDELRAVQLIKSIRHPFLLSIDRVECVAGELIIVTELADHNLFEVWEQYRRRGKVGVPREELLGYLREAAEVLDLLNQKFDLQHLDVKPHNLFLLSNHVKVADFGLVNSLAGGDLQIQLSAVTPLYAAPELFQGKLSRHCDQYSLAIVYQELLSGTLPLQGTNVRQLLVQHSQAEPDVSPLPERDRAIVSRALAKNPEHRFASCLDFLQALCSAGEDAPTVIRSRVDDFDTASLSCAGAVTIPTVLDTQKLAPRTMATFPEGVLPGERGVERLRVSPLMEVWRTQSPEGTKRQVQLLFGFGSDTRRLKDALSRLRSVQHPALLPLQIASVSAGRLVVVTEDVHETLRDRFQRCTALKQPGIPRAELLADLRAAAEVLDYLAAQHDVQHLSLTPRSLVLDHGWLRLAEFGYAHLLWQPAGQDVAQCNTRYAAPELFTRNISRHCDQYSLALIYAEMLTGVHPFRGRPASDTTRSRAIPDLHKLPEQDQAVIARALETDPTRRWPSCTDMMLALEGVVPEPGQVRDESEDHFTQLVRAERALLPPPTAHDADPGVVDEIIGELLTGTGDAQSLGAYHDPEWDGAGEELRHQFQVGLPLGSAHVKLTQYCEQHYLRQTASDEQGGTFLLSLPGSYWQQWIGRCPGLEFQVRLARVNPMSATPIEVSAHVRAVNCSGKHAQELLERLGHELLDGLQQQLLVNSEKRMQDRVLWPHLVRVHPLLTDGRRDEPIECRGKDISQTGIGLYLPHDLPTSQVLIELPSAKHPPAVAVPATLVRAKRCADGWYEVGALFHLGSRRRAASECHVPAHAR